MVELKGIITNGYVDAETMDKMLAGGWSFVCTVPAQTVHPKALPLDKASIFSKYTSYEEPKKATERYCN